MAPTQKETGLRYDVLIVKIADATVEAIIGVNLCEDAADQRVFMAGGTGLDRTNLDLYFVVTVPTGSYTRGAIFVGKS